MRKEFGSDIAEVQIATWLERFLLHGLMFQEGERYLSLATRKRALDISVGNC